MVTKRTSSPVRETTTRTGSQEAKQQGAKESKSNTQALLKRLKEKEAAKEGAKKADKEANMQSQSPSPLMQRKVRLWSGSIPVLTASTTSYYFISAPYVPPVVILLNAHSSVLPLSPVVSRCLPRPATSKKNTVKLTP